MSVLRVLNPGMFTTVQDLGRKGYQQYGMPVSGSMDTYAHKLANLLVGNEPEEATLEMTILGGTYVVEKDTFIAITGAHMNPVINNERILGMWRAIEVRKGDKLTFNAANCGCRTYLAIAGGFKIDRVMESKSTYVRGKLGGHQGRTLTKGDELGLDKHGDLYAQLNGRFISAQYIPKYEKSIVLRAILGPQEEAFTHQGIANFFSAEYIVSNEFDRMGYRLEGKRIEHVDSADILSDGIVKGAVQIPGHGNPIIMLSDCQTTGGYTKIAHIITSDLWKIAQAKAGDSIRFKAIDVEEAHTLLKADRDVIESIKRDFESKRLSCDQDLKMKINNQTFTVKVNEITAG